MFKFIRISACFILSGIAVTAADFSGRYATNWGVVELKQEGKKVVGSYLVPAPGEIEGVIDSDTLVYRWLQSNGVWGMGRFNLSEKGDKLRGTWGHGKSFDSGGVWEGARQ